MLDKIIKAEKAGHLLTHEIEKRPHGTDLVPGTILYCVPLDVEDNYYFIDDEKTTLFLLWNGTKRIVVKQPFDKRHLIEDANKKYGGVWAAIAIYETIEVVNRRTELYKSNPELKPKC